MSVVRREPWPLRKAIAAGLILALYWVLWITSVQLTTIARATLLVCTGALWSALLSRPLLGERISRQLWIGLVVALGGVAAVVTAGGSPGGTQLAGDLCALGGSFCWVGYTFLGRRARQTAGFWGYSSAVYGTTGLAVLAVALIQGVPLWGFSPVTWLVIAGLTVLPTLFGHGAMNYLLRFIGPAKLTLWTLSKPAIATLLAWIVFAEIPSRQGLAGGIAILVGISIGIAPPLLGTWTAALASLRRRAASKSQAATEPLVAQASQAPD